jgi:hypothetical protein
MTAPARSPSFGGLSVPWSGGPPCPSIIALDPTFCANGLTIALPNARLPGAGGSHRRGLPRSPRKGNREGSRSEGAGDEGARERAT